MVLVRWIAVAFALVQILAYSDRPYPDNLPVKALALGATGLLAAGNLTAWLAHRRARTARQARRLAVASLAMDVFIASAIVWLWAFDPLSALYPDSAVQWNSITFRMGIGLIIALVAGFIARNLTRQKELLEDALASLARTDRLRANLVSTLAHDVRNPLAAIRGTLRTVLSRPDRMTDQTRTELLTTADRQAGRLERLAADLLDLARLERGRLELSLGPVRLRESVLAALAYIDPHEEFDVSVDPDLVVRADAGRLEQIVVNLAANAFRYGKPPYEVAGRGARGPRGRDRVPVRALPDGAAGRVGRLRPGHRPRPGRGARGPGLLPGPARGRRVLRAPAPPIR
jgi:signal transduction histidine kinase